MESINTEERKAFEANVDAAKAAAGEALGLNIATIHIDLQKAFEESLKGLEYVNPDADRLLALERDVVELRATVEMLRTHIEAKAEFAKRFTLKNANIGEIRSKASD